MKTVSTALATHLSGESLTVCKLWKVKRVDGTILGSTDFDQDITYDDGTDTVTYVHDTGMTAKATEQSADMSSTNTDVMGFLDSSAITDSDIRAGKYDYAAIELRVVNWADLTMGDLKVLKGTVGPVVMINGQYTATVYGLTYPLSTKIGQTFGPVCRADLGDSRCQVNLAALRQTGTVTSVASLQEFTASGLTGAQNYFDDGVVTWLTGDNAGATMETGSWDGVSLVTLFLSMGLEIQVGDTFTIEPGCNHATTDCFNKFNNVINFQGENVMPGNDAIFDYPVSP